MEQLAQPSSGFEPLHSSTNIKFNSKTSNSQTVILDLPLKLAKSEKEKKNQADHQWNCYRNCISSQSLHQNYMNFKRSHAPVRLMQWKSGAWVEIAGEFLSAAKLAFSDRRSVVDLEVDGNFYVLDFSRMLQINVDSGLQRSIAWIDVNGDCFFPKFFADEYLTDDDDDDIDIDDDEEEEKNVKIELEIKIDTNNISNSISDYDNPKRKVREGKLECEEEDTAASSCDNSGIGNSKRQRLVSAVKSSFPNARLLGEGDRSFSVVRDLFMTGMKKVDPGVCITNIYRFVRAGPKEKSRLEGFHKQMEMTKTARGQSNLVFAWYGTSKKGVLDVLAHCFWSLNKVFGPQAHGVGVYFSPVRMAYESDLLTEADDNGEKHLLLCRVILGNVEKVDTGSQQFQPSSLNFDSGTDDLANPKRYIVWSTNMNTHILPEFVVSYKCENRQGQQPKVKEIMNWIPDGQGSVVTKLFTKLGSSLPASKLDEMRALCMAFKARRIPKDKFIKQLKCVVGDEVLRSAISEVQCAN